MMEAVKNLVHEVLGFGDYFPYFDPEKDIEAPYLFMYYSMPFIPSILPKLDPLSQNLVNQLLQSIEATHGDVLTVLSSSIFFSTKPARPLYTRGESSKLRSKLRSDKQTKGMT